MKPGFVLIEILLGSAIAALLGVLLFFSMYQTNRTTVFLDSTIDMQSASIKLLNQLSRDLSGIFVPVQAEEKKKEEENQKDTIQIETKQQEQPKPLQKVFYATNKDGMLSELTFITNNPLKQYARGPVGRLTPHVVRVVYRVQKDTTKRRTKPAYRLERQESTQLDYAAFVPGAQEQKIQAYTIIDTIKSIRMSYVVDAKKNDKENKKEKESSIKTVTEWNAQPDQPQHELFKKGIYFPDSVTITLVLWDNQQKQEKTFEYAIIIASDGSVIPNVIPEKTKKLPPEKEKAQAPNNAPQKKETSALNAQHGAQSPAAAQNLLADGALKGTA